MSEDKVWAEFNAFWNAPEQEELRMSCAKGWAFEVWQASRAAMQGEPVGYVSQDFLEGKWSLDHIAKSDEGQISRTIPVFAKPPQPAEQQPVPDVSALVEALEVMELGGFGKAYAMDIARAALTAHRKQRGSDNE